MDSGFPIGDYLQMACLGGHSVFIEVFAGGQEQVVGTITVLRGVLWDAEDTRGNGETAVRRLLIQADALGVCRNLDADPGPRKISLDWQVALIESAVEQDHTSVHRPPQGALPTEGAVPTLRDLVVGEDAERATDVPSLRDLVVGEKEIPDVGANELEQLVVRGTEALLSRNYDEALECFRAASALNMEDVSLIAKITRLEELQGSPRGTNGDSEGWNKELKDG